MSDPTDHVCPVAWADAHGPLDDSPMERSWCLSSYRVILLSPRAPAALSPRLKVMERSGIRVSDAPVDWANRAAAVVLVGITPGQYQATQAIAEARQRLLSGLSEQCLPAPGEQGGRVLGTDAPPSGLHARWHRSPRWAGP